MVVLWPVVATVVWCSGRWSGALPMVLATVVWCSGWWWPRHESGIASAMSECSALASMGLGGVYNVQGLGGGRGVHVSVPCVCTRWSKMALAYALTMWSAMADTVWSGGEQGEARRLTVGVEGERIAMQ